MPVKRRIAKKLGGNIEDAVRLFEEMRQLPCTCTAEAKARYRHDCPGCKRWWTLEPELRHALDLRLWHFPTISRHAPDPRYAWPDDSKQGRWLMLEQAAERRRQAAA